MSYTSLDFSTIQQEQVLNAFHLYLKESGSLLDRLLMNGRTREAGTANKYEWLGSQLQPLARSVNASSANTAFNTAANMTFISTTGLKAGQIIRFVDSAGLDGGDMQVKVNSVTNATVAVVVIYGGTTGIALDNTYTARLVSEPIVENEKTFVGDSEWIPSKEYNYFQIFRTAVELSDTSVNSLVHGDVNQIATQLKNAMYKIRQGMHEQYVRGRRVARASGVPGSFGGILQYLNMAGTNIVSASSSALDPIVINDLIQKIYEDGGTVNTIACNVAQARVISSFNRSGASGTNLYSMVDAASKDTGGYSLRFISDIPMMNGIITNIVIDDKMPLDQVALYDVDRMALVPYKNRALKMVDGTAPGQDGQTAILRGEYTLGFKDYKYSAGLITDLTV